MNTMDAKLMLEEIQDTFYQGSKSEDDFLKSIEVWLEDERKLTDKQAETLRGIHRKAKK